MYSTEYINYISSLPTLSIFQAGDEIVIFRPSAGAGQQVTKINVSTLLTTILGVSTIRFINTSIAANGTTIVFDTAEADANWQWVGTPKVIETTSGNIVDILITNKTANGFTAQLSTGLAGTIEGLIIHA